LQQSEKIIQQHGLKASTGTAPGFCLEFWTTIGSDVSWSMVIKNYK